MAVTKNDQKCFVHCWWECRRRQWHPTPVLSPGKSHGWRSLVGCSPRGRWGSDTTERLHFHFSLSCAGEGNGNPLQCSCLENPRDGGAWWAAVYGVAQSRTRLTRLSRWECTLVRQLWKAGWKVHVTQRFCSWVYSQRVPDNYVKNSQDLGCLSVQQQMNGLKDVLPSSSPHRKNSHTYQFKLLLMGEREYWDEFN